MDVELANENGSSEGFEAVAKYENLALMEGKDGRIMVHPQPLLNGCEDTWGWNRRDRSQEALLSGPGNRTVHFHPNWSKGTAGVRGTRILNNGRYYWELKLSDRIFGTR